MGRGRGRGLTLTLTVTLTPSPTPTPSLTPTRCRASQDRCASHPPPLTSQVEVDAEVARAKAVLVVDMGAAVAAERTAGVAYSEGRTAEGAQLVKVLMVRVVTVARVALAEMPEESRGAAAESRQQRDGHRSWPQSHTRQ